MAATTTASWQPQEEGFKEICGLLEQQISHSSSADKSQIWQQLQHYSQLPDFNNYLAFILARAEVIPNCQLLLQFHWIGLFFQYIYIYCPHSIASVGYFFSFLKIGVHNFKYLFDLILTVFIMHSGFH